MIPGEEISDKAEGVPVHINATNLRDVDCSRWAGRPSARRSRTTCGSVEEQAEKAGREILAHLNHPNFGWAITAEDMAHAVTERFFEVYNGHPGVNQPGDEHRPSIERLWDIANTIRLAELKRRPLYGIATDDSHHYHGKPNGARPGRGWTMVRATHLTPEYIIKAIKAGDCYASSGVTLADVRYDAQREALELDDRARRRRDVHDAVHRHAARRRRLQPADRRTPTASRPTDKSGKPLRVSRKYSERGRPGAGDGRRAVSRGTS